MNSRFFVLHEGFYGNVADRLQALERVALARGIEFISLDSLAIDYSEIPQLGLGDMLYNCARGSARLETLLINSAVTTFYVRNPDIIHDVSDSTLLTIHHEKLGLPAPRTIHALSSDPRLLERYVQYLGGFPVVLKVAGGSLGVGTMFVESMSSLRSLSEFLKTLGRDFILRQYIAAREVARLVVLGESVIAANRKFIARDDFRSNVFERPVEVASYDRRVEEIAVTAARSCNQEFSGVDILISKNGEPFLLETNSPHDFWTSERHCGVPIAEKMLEYLKNKMLKSNRRAPQ